MAEAIPHFLTNAGASRERNNLLSGRSPIQRRLIQNRPSCKAFGLRLTELPKAMGELNRISAYE